VKTTIYYFSGTGNSYAVARDIAQRIKAKLESIPNVMSAGKIHVDYDCIGIVFPSYIAAISGVPQIIERFVKKSATSSPSIYLRYVPAADMNASMHSPP